MSSREVIVDLHLLANSSSAAIELSILTTMSTSRPIVCDSGLIRLPHLRQQVDCGVPLAHSSGYRMFERGEEFLKWCFHSTIQLRFGAPQIQNGSEAGTVRPLSAFLMSI